VLVPLGSSSWRYARPAPPANPRGIAIRELSTTPPGLVRDAVAQPSARFFGIVFATLDRLLLVAGGRCRRARAFHPRINDGGRGKKGNKRKMNCQKITVEVKPIETAAGLRA